MPTYNKILGQKKPAAGIPTDGDATKILYTTPVAYQSNINIYVANQSSVEDYVYVALVRNSPGSPDTLSAQNFIAYYTTIQANSVLNFTGIALNQSDKIYVGSTNGNCSFVATGIEFN